MFTEKEEHEWKTTQIENEDYGIIEEWPERLEQPHSNVCKLISSPLYKLLFSHVVINNIYIYTHIKVHKILYYIDN